MSTQATEKAPQYHCDKCDFTCFKKSGWNRHITTSKHVGLDKQGSDCKTQFICDCGNTYADRSGLWRHSFKCVHKKGIECKEEKDQECKESNLIKILINENRDLKKIILELIKKDAKTIIFNNKTHELTIIPDITIDK
jgi:hypothetical protein